MEFSVIFEKRLKMVSIIQKVLGIILNISYDIKYDYDSEGEILWD